MSKLTKKFTYMAASLTFVVSGSSVIAGLLSACSGGQATSPDTEFSGPWGAEFEQAHENADSEFAKKVLATGQITERDMSEAQEIVRRCLEDEGYIDVIFNDDGSSSFGDPLGRDTDKTRGTKEECMSRVGYEALEEIYYPMRINPENLDFATIIVECLKEKGAVDKSFTVKDYDQLFQDDHEIPLDSELFWQCNEDPLGLNQ